MGSQKIYKCDWKGCECSDDQYTGSLWAPPGWYWLDITHIGKDVRCKGIVCPKHAKVMKRLLSSLPKVPVW